MTRLTDLREILRYVPHFRDKVFVIALDGAVVADDNIANLLLDVAVLRSLRIGVVLSAAGGALATMLPPFRFGVGGVLGSGQQYMSWIAIDDLLGSILHVLHTSSLQGPVNAVAPNTTTNREFTKTLGRVLERPTILPVPAPAARLAFGEMADEALLASTRVTPTRLAASGYQFRHAHLEEALRHTLGKAR